MLRVCEVRIVNRPLTFFTSCVQLIFRASLDLKLVIVPIFSFSTLMTIFFSPHDYSWLLGALKSCKPFLWEKQVKQNAFLLLERQAYLLQTIFLLYVLLVVTIVLTTISW